MASSPKRRTRRSAHDISRLLNEQSEKGFTASEFCTMHGISKQTYYKWRQRYGSSPSSAQSFIALKVPPAEAIEPTLFCDITISGSTSIRFYRPIDAKFIKALNLY